MTWNTRPADDLVPQAPPAPWLLFEQPARHVAGEPRNGNRIRQQRLLRRDAHQPRLHLYEPEHPHRRRTGRDAKLSIEVFGRPCGTPFSVVCQNGQLEQAYFLRYYSKEQSLLNAPRLVVNYTTLATPSLIRVVSTGGNGAFVIGRVDGASNLPITVAASTASTCTAGALPGAGWPLDLGVSDDRCNRLFQCSRVGRDSRRLRHCARHFAGCDGRLAVPRQFRRQRFWPKALPLAGSTPTARDFIDSPGKARWYKFDVTPGQRIEVELSGLPADYDLAVFKDIGQAFAAQLTPGRCRRSDQAQRRVRAVRVLAVRFSPSVFSPSVFSPTRTPVGVLAVRVQPECVQPVGVLAVGVLAVGVQPERVQPVGVLARRVSARPCSRPRCSRRRCSARRFSAGARSRRRSRARRRGASSGSRRRRARATSPSSSTPGTTRAASMFASPAAAARSTPQPVHGGRREGRDDLRRRHRHDADATPGFNRRPGPRRP